MTTYAYIKEGIVTNIAHFDGEQSAETLSFIASRVGADEIILEAQDCEIGGTYANGVFTRAPEPVVEEVVAPVEETPAE